MKITLIAVGNKMPKWVESGFSEYQKRLPPEMALTLHEIAPGPMSSLWTSGAGNFPRMSFPTSSRP